MNASDPSQPRSQTDDLWQRFEEARARGGSDDIERFCADHPEHAERLRDLWRADQLLRRGLAAEEDEPVSAAELEALLERLRSRGRLSSRYRIEHVLGRGGMGIVYAAFDEDLGRRIAFKTLSGELSAAAVAQPIKLARFLEEAQVTGQLEHPSIVPVYELGLDEADRVYYTMQLVEGETLARVFERARNGTDGWTRERALGVLQRVCDAVAFAHSRRVLHRDLKPSNVMVGSFGQVYVMDWGLARVLARRSGVESGTEKRPEVETARRSSSSADSPVLQTQAGQKLGTPAYMSPEQAAGANDGLDARSDVYALGAILYELLAGHPPYLREGSSSDPHEVLRRVVVGPPEPIASVARGAPEELVAICERAMARDSAVRYASVVELAADLGAYLEGRVVRAHRTGAWIELRKWVGRNRATAASLGAAVAAVALGAGVFAWLRSVNEVQAKEHALAESGLKQSALAQSHLARARLGAQRGAWADVLESIERAREAGYEDSSELGLLTAEALLAKGQSRSARAVLASVEVERMPSGQRGRLRLLQSEIEQTPQGSARTALDLVRSALDEELAPADRAYARGMLAERTTDSLAAFDEALALDPFHFGARNARLSTLFFLGRYDEAEEAARTQASLFPEDPAARAFQALVASARGEAERAERLYAELERELGSQVVDLVRIPGDIVAKFDRLPSTTFMGELRKEDLEPVFARFGELLAMRPADDPEHTRSMLVPQVATVAAAYETLAGMILPKGGVRPGMLGPLLAGEWRDVPILVDPARCAKELEAIVERHDEGVFHFFHGVAVITSPLAKGEVQADKQRRALASFERAWRTPCIVPKFEHMARYLAARAYNDLIAHAKDDSMRPAAIEMIRATEVGPLSDWDEIGLVASLSMTCRVGTEGLRLVDDWIELHPDDVGARASRTNVLRMLGALDLAASEADALFATHPDHPKVKTARDEARKAIAARDGAKSK
ncbi:MAG: protein kinase [Planctomycetes bacterium]|nr:protein kinase [Planctomycetota bacterium]